ncbi:META domain-containing protein [Deinococcus soli (ex Cha et al. 2016)]|uniref:META domain-containing protein n=1 Tax=Deinococcus soli (ex Cha et al. 2016) TaxID=1309411 RepID=UPI001663484A|nr:META domain-containing protein [Deinococcus soli (ex Cha et al. 2016)]GGB78042.1 META domain-containing protein [Deinococcus soli (ex Cha et al. 2016)]
MSALLTSLTLAALAAPALFSPANPAGVTWTLGTVQPAGRGAITPGAALARPTLRLDGSGASLKITGNTGCSPLTAQAALKGQALVVRGVQAGGSERCTDAALSLREDYLRLLNATTRYDLNGGTLILSGGAGRLTFTRTGGAMTDTPTDSLDGTWQMRVTPGPAGPERGQALLRFTFSGAKVTVAGLAGCNTVTGSGAVIGQRVVFGGVASTRKLCPGAAGTAENRILGLLRAPLTIERQGGALVLRGQSGQLTLTRAPVPAPTGGATPDPAATYTLTRLNGQPAPRTLRPVTLSFRDGRLGGSDGCNSVGGEYVIRAGRVELGGGLMGTKMACPDQPDLGFQTFFEQRPTLTVQGGTLTLRTAEDTWEFQAR